MNAQIHTAAEEPNAKPARSLESPTVLRPTRKTPARERFGLLIVVLLPALVGWLTRREPTWVTMWAMAVTQFFALKVLTLTGLELAGKGRRVAAYLLAWPGMNAAEFLGPRRATERLAVGGRELAWALAKLVLGLAASGWAVAHVFSRPPLLVGWVGMIGLIFSLHFGLLHVVSWFWRRAGVAAPPIMRAPLLATSLAQFWSSRWNIAFAESARRFLFRPLSRQWGTLGAGGLVFLISGVVHEMVISAPARGGWGGPTLYFVLQATGIGIERSALGARWGLGRGLPGWAWTLVVTALPVPLLFHAPFVERVIVPMYKFFAVCLH